MCSKYDIQMSSKRYEENGCNGLYLDFANRLVTKVEGAKSNYWLFKPIFEIQLD